MSDEGASPEPAEPSTPASPAASSSPAKEWAAAVILMALFALILAGLLSFFRGGFV